MHGIGPDIERIKHGFNATRKVWKRQERNPSDLERKVHNAIVNMVAQTYPQAKSFRVSLKQEGINFEPAPAFGEERLLEKLEDIDFEVNDNDVTAILPEGYFFNYRPAKSKIILKPEDVVHNSQGKFLFRFRNNKLIVQGRDYKFTSNEATKKFNLEGYIDEPVTSLFVENGQTFFKFSDQEYFFCARIGHKGVLICPSRDKQLQKMIFYLKKEFQCFNYSQKEKLKRITHFAHVIFSKISREEDRAVAFIGDYARSGKGICRHHASLIKALADSLELKVTLVQGAFPEGINEMSAHAWCVGFQNGKEYILDSLNVQFFNRKKICSPIQELFIEFLPKRSYQEHLKKVLCEQHANAVDSIILQKKFSDHFGKLKPFYWSCFDSPDVAVLQTMKDIVNKYKDQDNSADEQAIDEFKLFMKPFYDEFTKKIIELL